MMQPYLVFWNISEAQEALKSVNENFVCRGRSLRGSGAERKAEIEGNERCSRGKVNFISGLYVRW